MSTTPAHIMKTLRQRNGIAADDTSFDAELDAMPPLQKLRAVAAWELGSPDWADQFITWATQCGIQITDPRELTTAPAQTETERAAAILLEQARIEVPAIVKRGSLERHIFTLADARPESLWAVALLREAYAQLDPRDEAKKSK